MNITPTADSVYFLLSEKGERVAIIKGKDIYALVPLSGEEIAELFNNGDALPLIQSEMKRVCLTNPK